MKTIGFCLLCVACTSTTTTEPGLYRNVTVDGIEREYLVYVPANAPASAPAVVMLHGTSGDGEKFYNISGWREKADAEGLIAVFPSALTYCLGEDDKVVDGVISDDEYRVTTKWVAGRVGTAEIPLCPAERLAMLPADKRALADHPLMDDVAFLDAIVADITSTDDVDPKRIYVTGFSNGGSMSARLMVERTNTFAAFAMNGGGATVTGTALRPAAAVFAVGSKDDRFTVPNGVAELPLDETVFDLPGMGGAVDSLCAALSLDCAERTSTISAGQVGVHRFTQSTVGASNELAFAVIGDATHQYPNGSNHPLVMADVLWDFFVKYSL